MVSNLAYKTIKKAVIIRVKRGEAFEEIVIDYPKLSDKQKAQMFIELVDEGVIKVSQDEDE